jgi:hypothetical protein
MAAQAATISLSHHEPLQRLSISGSSTVGSQKIGAVGPVEMNFDALGRSFELELSPNGRLLDTARDLAGNTVIPYRGTLAGNANSWVRIVVADGVPAGLIWDGSELFAIERPGDNIVGSDSTIIYRLADAMIASGSMTCGAGGSLTNGGAVYKTLTAELSATTAQAEGAVSEIDIGIVADAEFFARHGNNSQQRIIDRMSLVDGYFSEQVGIQINWPLVQIFTDPSNGSYPFTATVSVGDDVPASDNLLDQLADFRNSEPNQHANGLTHLWTGKDIEGRGGNRSTVGIAYQGALCRQRFGAGLSEGLGNTTFDSLVAAHEIGHNFGAPHDGQSGSACESVDTSGRNEYLMEPSLNGSSTFSQCSLEQMADDIAQASCITPLPSVDMSFGVGGSLPAVLLGNTATITFDVVNLGTEEAANVVADFMLPANVSLAAAAASLGTCTDGGGMVNCAIGNVQGSTTVTVTLTSDTVAIGSGTFDASVSADIDDDTTNNLSSLTLTVDPAVNLSVTPPSTQQLAVDRSTGLTALLENTSVLDATGVTLNIALSSGLRVDSASWPLGACTVSNTQVDCDGASFGALSNVTLSLGVTALTEGSKTINFSMSSAEDEADPSNNTASATLNVTPPQEESSGGGAVLWLLPLLGLFAFRRRGLFPG